VGNRALGERLTTLVPRGARKLAAALLLLAPDTPLLFMGQEYDESQPFQFFADFGDPVLQKAVSEGRRHEFKDFDWTEVPDPQDPATFERSRLTWKQEPENREMLEWYLQLIAIRRRHILTGDRTCRAEWRDGVLTMQVPAESPRLLVIAGFDLHGAENAGSEWKSLLQSEEDGYSVKVYCR
jgi:maltooligosyltrehalose trehalohydrolase